MDTKHPTADYNTPQHHQDAGILNGGSAAPPSYGTVPGAQAAYTDNSYSTSTVTPRAHHATTDPTMSNGASDVLLLIMALLLPPVAVFLKRGCGADFIINILLCILGWLPGVLHGFYVVVKYPGNSGQRAVSSRKGI